MPTVGVDYMYMHSEGRDAHRGGQGQRDEDDHGQGGTERGGQNYAVEVAERAVECLDHRRVIMRSDSEPAILALKEAVRRETDVEIILQAVPAGDHPANGLVENAAKNVQGQLRVIKDAVHNRHKTRADGEHPAAPCMVMHAASVVSRGGKD